MRKYNFLIAVMILIFILFYSSDFRRSKSEIETGTKQSADHAESIEKTEIYEKDNIENNKKENPVINSEEISTENNIVRIQYESYKEELDRIRVYEDIAKAGFKIVEEQVFPLKLKEQSADVIPALHTEYNRLALFFVGIDGKVLFCTQDLETNKQNYGEMLQLTKAIEAISIRDLNGDGLDDIILITSFENRMDNKGRSSYRIGDVLFQSLTEEKFYQDYRITDKINRFEMNKSSGLITAFVKDGKSVEFMYVSTSMEELLENKFRVISEEAYEREFEKLGKLQVVPGTYTIGEYDIFMVYIVNKAGKIISSFCPMDQYDNLYTLRGIRCTDIDGDGLEDIVVLAKYSYEGENGDLMVETDYSVYYQRTTGFFADTEMKKSLQCSEEESMQNLIRRSRAYWGWETEE